jgi:quercetin dioxygenase-like cupin family protein
MVGDSMMIAKILLKKGSHVPMHSHHNEQITYILEGALRFNIDNRVIVVAAGQCLIIPPHMPHEAFAEEDTIDLDIFSPPREDWMNKSDAYLRNATQSK